MFFVGPMQIINSGSCFHHKRSPCRCGRKMSMGNSMRYCVRFAKSQRARAGGVLGSSTLEVVTGPQSLQPFRDRPTNDDRDEEQLKDASLNNLRHALGLSQADRDMHLALLRSASQYMQKVKRTPGLGGLESWRCVGMGTFFALASDPLD